MNLKPYPKPTCCQRAKIAFHYLLPQLAITRLAGWFAEKEWGRFTHFVIKYFAKCYKVDWHEAQKSQPSDFKNFNEFFTRELKDGARPIVSGSHEIALPADGRVSEGGAIHGNLLLQAKGHMFSLADLLAGDTDLAQQFENGVFLTTYLSPRDYHRVHMPCAGTLRKMIYVSGELFSVNPFLAQHVPNLFARNERVICVFDTEFGTMVQILVGATVTASMSTVWHGVVNPPRNEAIRVWDYPADGDQAVHLAKGAEMGAFRLGSTVINLFQENKVLLNANLQAGVPTKMGELLGTLAA
ncbi:archaetidylserine decarboxylase [Alysiella filiformis]|uniref:Phosphatidylserine decarboxylase proenzyme n=1 Tax=Alysiella filiformis DSM 16848 TaxID=1120981 RepID=A0A286E8V7_9NEIS|nr:archaetidylserine decarboxylase [Alysiella filiformis]QMT32121.1 phosphatidylserine decarboxylase [Alysiella filiformis]UBQ56964.1 archaetidylserine decarboxylase [Alysiella filiformis DSM 16848]SOD67323.1 phosphatidylserine decarboxylase [Alysiella filiformis DSM 16848]